MKKSFYLLFASFVLLSCGKDDGPVITHEMGTWELDSYILSNVPEGFKQKNEGQILAVNEISFGGGVTIESYELTLNSDMTYKRTIGVTGPDIKDDGTWVFEDDVLTLTPEDEDEQEYRIEENDNDQLWWSVESQFLLLHDTVTADYYNSLDNEGQNELFTAVSIDLVYAFERQ
jgi:hypothetical protein